MARTDARELEIERMPPTEQRFGVELGGLFATAKGPDSDGDYTVTVSGEILAVGESSDTSLDIVAAVYDARGRVVGTSSQYLSDFGGFDTFDVSEYVRVRPERVRVYVRGS